MSKIAFIGELDKILKEKFGAKESSIEEINTFETYSLKYESKEELEKIHKVYKLVNAELPRANDYLEYFLLVELNNERLVNIRQLGMGDKNLEKLLNKIAWFDNER